MWGGFARDLHSRFRAHFLLLCGRATVLVLGAGFNFPFGSASSIHAPHPPTRSRNCSILPAQEAYLARQRDYYADVDSFEISSKKAEPEPKVHLRYGGAGRIEWR